MHKIFQRFIISVILFISVITTCFADHTDTFSEQWRPAQKEISYTGSDMAGFLLIQKAKEKKDEILEGLSRWPQQQQDLIHNLIDDRGSDELVQLFFVFVLMMVVGFVVEKALSYRMGSACNRLIEQKKNTWTDTFKVVFTRAIFQFICLGIFVVVGTAIAAYNYDSGDSFRILCWHALSLVAKIRALDILLKLILAPYQPTLRLMKMTTVSAQRLYYSIMLFVSLFLVITTFWRVLAQFGLEPIMFAILVPISGFILNISSIFFVLFNRKDFTAMFKNHGHESTNFTRIFAQIWPTIISIWVLIIWVIWAANEFLGNYEQALQASKAWWLTFGFPVIDRLIFLLLSQLKRVTWLQSHSYERRCDIFINRVIIAIRILLLAAILYLIDSSFGYNAWEMLTSNFAGYLTKSVDIIVVIILAYAVWEIIQSAIERHLPLDIAAGEDDGLSSLEGDGGGSGASRSETLLPLIRSFLLVFLIISVVLMILSIAGVEIAPLLAGAGIVGIAVGFGAQKLVQDVISGIFFLLDDAFRRGEYIEAASLRGTVERISIRSIRLRHHLGAVQTIPFGEIATVRNLSRDWITMKLEFRLDYRTDVEKVRKLIKKVGQTMLEHPEYGQHFLLPLKSQGVIRVEESALIFRMKFTCVPGEQWVIRREAFTLVKNALKASGIEFAHRSVHVLMHPSSEQAPPQSGAISLEKTSGSEHSKIAGAAASSVAQSIRHNDRIDFEGNDFDTADN
ncbi:mechanosensitive ion channel domain-containing protein [Gammaproteobacteria bacterium AS21]